MLFIANSEEVNNTRSSIPLWSKNGTFFSFSFGVSNYEGLSRLFVRVSIPKCVEYGLSCFIRDFAALTSLTVAACSYTSLILSTVLIAKSTVVRSGFLIFLPIRNIPLSLSRQAGATARRVFWCCILMSWTSSRCRCYNRSSRTRIRGWTAIAVSVRLWHISWIGILRIIIRIIIFFWIWALWICLKIYSHEINTLPSRSIAKKLGY